MFNYVSFINLYSIKIDNQHLAKKAKPWLIAGFGCRFYNNDKSSSGYKNVSSNKILHVDRSLQNYCSDRFCK
jgi:hypothetical protein